MKLDIPSVMLLLGVIQSVYVAYVLSILKKKKRTHKKKPQTHKQTNKNTQTKKEVTSKFLLLNSSG